MTILLNDIFKITEPEQYKLHLACRDKYGNHPLDVFVRDPEEWIGWNEWRGKRNDWTRTHVLSFMEFYPQSHAWLFGGAFEVTETRPDGYSLEPQPHFNMYVGRLLTSFHRYQGMRGRGFLLENYLDQFTVTEILPQVYSGEKFPGFGNINHDFRTLETIFQTERADWMAALENVQGIYIITDRSNGKHYVGSAYGDDGIWSRWACYIDNGHGGNRDLMKLVRQRGQNHARKHFQFAILEIMNRSTDDDIIAREGHWKHVLGTREHGYNRN